MEIEIDNLREQEMFLKEGGPAQELSPTLTSTWASCIISLL
jgi:hypothetical protein